MRPVTRRHPSSVSPTRGAATSASRSNRVSEGAPSDAEAIAVMLCETFDGVTAEQARRDVEAALTELQALALVEVAQ